MPSSPPPITAARAAPLRMRPAPKRRDIGEIAEGDDAGQVHARLRQADRLRAGGEDELGEWQDRPVRQAHRAACRIDRVNRAAEHSGRRRFAATTGFGFSVRSPSATSPASSEDSSTRL